jgi:hypothetical protein
MSARLSLILTALLPATFVGAVVFGVLAPLDWALAQDIGLAEHAMAAAVAAALPVSLLAAWYVGRLAYAVEKVLQK